MDLQTLDWTFDMGAESSPGQTWMPWRDAAKTFLWSLKIDPPPGHAGVHDTSIASMFKLLRMLMRWMATQGYRRFAELDRDASERFLAVIAERRGNAGTPLKWSTLQNYRRMLSQLYLQGARYPLVAIADPSLGMGWGGRAGDKGWLPYTPDALAVALVSAALRLLGTPADEVIALHTKAQSAYDDGLARGLSQTKVGFAVVAAIAEYRFSTLPNEDTPWHALPVRSTKVVRQLVDRIYEACFVVVAYLVGARVSEIIGLKVECIEHHPAADGNESFAYLVGRIYKTASTHDGNVHRWVAPPAVERAIAVMERLTEPMRRRTQRTDLWLAMTSSGLLGPCALITVPTGSTIIRRLNKGFAPFINLPLHQGKRWHLNTHQGRKTFARFVGKRDRTGLPALQGHLGHLSRVMTDRGYVGTDFALDELIDRHAQEETRAALEELLTATALGGKGGRIIAGRSQFRGRTRDGNLQAYVNFLMAETDLRLGGLRLGLLCVPPGDLRVPRKREGAESSAQNRKRLRFLRQLCGDDKAQTRMGSATCAQRLVIGAAGARSAEQRAGGSASRRMRPNLGATRSRPGDAAWVSVTAAAPVPPRNGCYVHGTGSAVLWKDSSLAGRSTRRCGKSGIA
jgi:hypothetical protein